MRSGVLFLAALTAARASAAPPSIDQANDVDEAAAYNTFDEEIDHFEQPHKSNGFILVSNGTGPGCEGTSELINEVTGLYLQGYHTGAGTAAAILHDIDLRHDGHIFYLNGTRGDQMSILTDEGQPQVPYGLVMPGRDDGRSVFDDEEYEGGFYAPFEDPYQDAVTFRAGPGTPAMMGPLHQGVINLQGTGTFIACNRSLPYNRHSWAITVNYLYVNGEGDGVASRCDNGVTPANAPAGIPDHCVPISLVALCARLPPAVVGGYASHADTHPVNCHALIGEDEDEDEFDWLYEDGEEEETGAEETEAEETGVETKPEAAEPEVEPEHAEAEHAEAEHAEAEHTEAEHTEAEHTEADHTEADHTEADHTEADHTEAEQATEQAEHPSEKTEL